MGSDDKGATGVQNEPGFDDKCAVEVDGAQEADKGATEIHNEIDVVDKGGKGVENEPEVGDGAAVQNVTEVAGKCVAMEVENEPEVVDKGGMTMVKHEPDNVVDDVFGDIFRSEQVHNDHSTNDMMDALSDDSQITLVGGDDPTDDASVVPLVTKHVQASAVCGSMDDPQELLVDPRHLLVAHWSCTF